jgi:hypothetical protein
VDHPAAGARRAAAALQAAGNGPATAERIVPSLEDVFIHHVQEQESPRAKADAAP